MFSLAEQLAETAGDGRAVSSARVGERIRYLRRARRWSVREFATRINVSAATVSAIENGHTAMTIDRIDQVARVLRVSPLDLIGMAPAGVPGEGREERWTSTSSGSVANRPKAGVDWREFPPLAVDAVMASAIRCFVETGYHGANMRAIAEGAGMSVAGVYHHYASKQQLLVEILDLTMDELDWRLAAARNSVEGDDRGPLARLGVLVEALALFHTLRRDLAFIGASEMRSLEPPQRRRIAHRRTAIQRLLDVEINDALADNLASTTTPGVTGRAIATMCTSLPQWFTNSGPTRPQEIAREYAALALRMIGAS